MKLMKTFKKGELVKKIHIDYIDSDMMTSHYQSESKYFMQQGICDGDRYLAISREEEIVGFSQLMDSTVQVSPLTIRGSFLEAT